MNPTEKHIEQEDIEDDYRESEDEDFNPDQIDNSLSDHEVSDEEDNEKVNQSKSKPIKPTTGSDDEEPSYEDEYGNEDIETPGEGGLIKTRSQRLIAEQAEKQYKMNTAQKSSLDIDSLWSEMNVTKNTITKTPSTISVTTTAPTTITPTTITPAKSLAEETITINRRYVFAGQEMTETKTVLQSSAEAQAYLKELSFATGIDNADSSTDNTPTLSTPLTSKPTITKPAARPRKRVSKLDALAGKAPKLNTLEKSKLDWQGFVDREGIQDDLVKFNKGKSGYLDRQDFLSRVEHRNEQLRKK